jgi:hypothetical protein
LWLGEECWYFLVISCIREKCFIFSRDRKGLLHNFWGEGKKYSVYLGAAERCSVFFNS